MAAPVKSLVIVGRDAPVWLAANVLQAALPLTVQVVELPTLLRPADVQATQPAIEALHTLLGIEEAHLLKATGGAFSLGQSFRDDQGSFFHPYGSVGAPIGNQPFLPHWVKARQFGLAVAFEDFSLTAAAAKQGRMLAPSKETEGFARTEYGYHLPAPAYAGYLKGLALRRGVQARQTAAIHVHVEAESGAICGIGLEGGERVEGDLYLDATGPEALLIGAALGMGRESWRGYFPCDRFLTLSGERFSSVPIFAQIRAQPFGWLGFYPTQNGTGLLAAYDSAAWNAEEVSGIVARSAKMGQNEAIVSSSDPGRRREVWVKNCVALGEAASSFDPVHNVDLQAVQMALVHLLALFPVSAEFEAERREYNRLLASGYDRLCDFQAAHYATPRSAVLAHKMETFQARGIIPLLDEESFPLESWQSLLLGHGLMPESWSPSIDATPGEVMKEGFKAILARIKQLVEQQPSHDSYLEIFCS